MPEIIIIFSFFSDQKNTTVLDIHVVISSRTGNWLKVPCNLKTGVICHVRCWNHISKNES